MPVHELLPGGSQIGPASERPHRLVLDLERLASIDIEEAALLGRFTATIQAQRGDYNGRVLTIREDDLRTLAVIYNEPASVLADRFVSWGVLRPDPGRSPQADQQSDNHSASVS